MRLIDVLKYINELNNPVFTSNDIAAYLNIKNSHASKILSRLSKSNHLIHLKKGIWAVTNKIDPLALPNYLLSPVPCYISFYSALYYRNVIDQIPSIIYVATLHKTIKFITPIATISAHQIHPRFFFGYTYDEKNNIKMASAEKALIDTLYLYSSRSKLFRALPELDMDEINIKKAKAIIKKIPSKRLKSLVLKLFDALVK